MSRVACCVAPKNGTRYTLHEFSIKHLKHTQKKMALSDFEVEVFGLCHICGSQANTPAYVGANLPPRNPKDPRKLICIRDHHTITSSIFSFILLLTDFVVAI